MIDFANHPETLRIIKEALYEDVHEGDHTTLATIDPNYNSKAKCIIKDNGILAAIAFSQKVFEQVDPNLKTTIFIEDGTEVKKGDIAFEVDGAAASILVAERLVLNAMQRMSGIATQAHKAAEIVKGTGCQVLDTRKTTPLVRHLEKWAVKIGGGGNHRFGLYDRILIKDNHIDYCGGITQALTKTYEYLKNKNLSLEVEIETRNLNEVQEVLNFGKVDYILLDNMDVEMLKEAVKLVDGRAKTEASGNITLLNLRAKAETGVNFISMGALTHSFTSLDISLKAVK